MNREDWVRRGRHWRNYLHAGYWADYLRELGWRLGPELRSSQEPSFPLDPGKLAKLTIRWPSSYEWQPTGIYVNPMRRSISRLVRVEAAPLSQRRDVVIIQAVYGGHTHDIAIDYGDASGHIDAECVQQCAVYFKMQHLAAGYPSEKYDARKIIPGGYVSRSADILRCLRHVRPLTQQPARFEVYGRFGTLWAKEIRVEAVRLLNEQRSFRYEGGLKLVRYSRFVQEIAQSKICIDLPGNGPFCHRLVDYFAIGSCVIGPRHESVLHAPLEDRRHIVYARPDLSDLIPLCEYYLTHDEEREEIRRQSRQYFEKYLHPDQLGMYYLQQILQRIE